MTASPDLRRAARQNLETTLLLGVDFVPRASINARAAVDASASTDLGVEAAATFDPPTAPHEADAMPRRAPNPPLQRPDFEAGSTHASTPAPACRSAAEKQIALDALRLQHDAQCPHCTAATGHTRLVFGEGNPDAQLMFVGEAPGETEDQLGRPFVGRAGQKLDDIIRAMGLQREDVYIANVLKARPPGNRTPLQHEIEGCGPYLSRQIQIIQPKVIVALGGPAAKTLLGVETGITRLRGIWASLRAGDLEVPVMPTFHPAYLLRNYTPQTRKQVWSDMQAVLARLQDA
jgi:uracil-DNA glycosylase family 4